jgi:hypothetical protein
MAVRESTVVRFGHRSDLVEKITNSEFFASLRYRQDSGGDTDTVMAV